MLQCRTTRDIHWIVLRTVIIQPPCLSALLAIAPISLWISVIFLHGFWPYFSQGLQPHFSLIFQQLCSCHRSVGLTMPNCPGPDFNACHMWSLKCGSCTSVCDLHISLTFKISTWMFYFLLTSFGMESSKRSSLLAFHCMMICLRCSRSWKIAGKSFQGQIYRRKC